jgi:hypothetical protein
MNGDGLYGKQGQTTFFRDGKEKSGSEPDFTSQKRNGAQGPVF